jgi:hypothetical protein
MVRDCSSPTHSPSKTAAAVEGDCTALVAMPARAVGTSLKLECSVAGAMKALLRLRTTSVNARALPSLELFMVLIICASQASPLFQHKEVRGRKRKPKLKAQCPSRLVFRSLCVCVCVHAQRVSGAGVARLTSICICCHSAAEARNRIFSTAASRWRSLL